VLTDLGSQEESSCSFVLNSPYVTQTGIAQLLHLQLQEEGSDFTYHQSAKLQPACLHPSSLSQALWESLLEPNEKLYGDFDCLIQPTAAGLRVNHREIAKL
jgi:hypothetical protein